MDGSDQTMAHHADDSPPSIGFPLGTALLIAVVLCLSGVFSCCYHWDRMRSISSRPLSPDSASVIETGAVSNSKSPPADVNSKQNHDQSLPVLMPGDEVPKYIAWRCPCNPSAPPENIIIDVQTPPSEGLPAA